MTLPMPRQMPRLSLPEPELFQAPKLTTLRLPNELGAIGGIPKKVVAPSMEDISTPIQRQKASDLLRAFTEDFDSTSPNLRSNQRIHKSFAELIPPMRITAVDIQNHRIQVQGDDGKLVTVPLPPQLRVNSKGTGLFYTPPVFATSPKGVLAAAQDLKQVAPPTTRGSNTTVKRAPVVFGRTPTAKEKQAAAQAEALAAQQQLAQQQLAQQQARDAAAQKAAAAAKAAQTATPTTPAKPLEISPQPAAPVIAREVETRMATQDFSRASSVISEQAMAQRVDQKFEHTAQRIAQANASFSQAAQAVGTDQVAKQATRDAEQQTATEVNRALYVENNDPTQRITPNKAAAGAPGRK